MKFDTLKIKGHTLDVHVDDNGRFSCTFQGQTVYAPMLAQLRAKLSRAITMKGAKISIPFVKVDNSHLRHGSITGVHAQNRNLLVKWEAGKGKPVESEQYSSWDAHELVPPEFGDELLRLSIASETADRELADFKEKHCFNGEEAVEKALLKAGEGVESAD